MRDRHHHHHHHHHYQDRDGYAHRAGEPGPGPNPYSLRRDKEKGVVAGVLAGVARYFGWNVGVLRWGLVILTVFTFPLPLIAYAVAAFAMKASPERYVTQDPEEQRFWRTFNTRPKATFSELKHRFRAIDARLADLETAVTSDEYGLRKAFRDLERGA